MLAFTLPPRFLADLQAEWPLRVIGRVEAGSGVRLLDEAGRVLEAPAGGYQHFGSPRD